jgi:hypothetical protein
LPKRAIVSGTGYNFAVTREITQGAARPKYAWALGLGAIGLSIALGAAIVRPNWGMGVAAALIALWGLIRCIQYPESGLKFCFWAFPWYAVLRGMIILQFPVALFGVRFWAELVIGGVFGGLLLRDALSRKKLLPVWDDFPALTYLFLCLYGATLTALTQSPLYLVYGFHFVVFPSLFYWAVRWLRPDRAASERILRAFLGGFVLLALASFYAFFVGPEIALQWNHAVRQQVYDLVISRGGPKIDPLIFWRAYLRMQSLLFEENVWGSLCSFVSLLSAAFLVVRKKSLGWLALFLLSTAGLALSVARGAVVGWGVGMLVLFVQRQRFSWRLNATLAILGVLVGGGALYLSEQPNVALWLQLGERALTGIESGSFDDRADQWKIGWDLLQRNPSGIGLGTVGYSASGTGIAQSKVADGNYVSLGAEMGWLGLTLLGVVLLSALWVLVRRQRALTDPATRALGLGLTGYLVAMAVHAVSANVFEYYYTFPVFWALLGVFVSRCADRRDVA